jgi:hypothetical protein
MPQPAHFFKTLGGGVPVHYDRLPSPHHYGSRGKARKFHCKTDFEPLLDAAFRDVWLYTGLGKAEVITSAGAYVDKPGQHGQGRALDIDGIFGRTRPSSPYMPAGKDMTVISTSASKRFCACTSELCWTTNTTRPIGITFTLTIHKVGCLESHLV